MKRRCMTRKEKEDGREKSRLRGYVERTGGEGGGQGRWGRRV